MEWTSQTSGPSFSGEITSNEYYNSVFNDHSLVEYPFFSQGSGSCNIGQVLQSINFDATNQTKYGYYYFTLTLTDVNGYKYYIDGSGSATPE